MLFWILFIAIKKQKAFSFVKRILGFRKYMDLFCVWGGEEVELTEIT